MTVSIDLMGRRVLVAGGSSGIGLGIARRFLDADAEVSVTGTRATPDEYADTDLGGMSFHQLDIVDDAAVTALAASFDRLDVLVVSVGTVAYSRAEYTMDIFRSVIDVNLNGVMSVCTAFHPLLSKSAGSVVLIGSTSSFIATPGQPAYAASKGALVTLTKSLAHAWARDSIRVNGVAPGLVSTKLTERSRYDEAVYEASLESIPLRRWGDPADMGDASLFLASDLSSYVTGQMLLVDGGATLM
ncbi:MAG: SDR family oxidoreductase [Ilumatobacteraceae bacterium]|nr:3-oxoacyl-ACP reductase [Acidimicrobiaceae bacterium]MDW3216253.1 SDR family oxidoreductase [Ilumatobacteraceae bacterium]